MTEMQEVSVFVCLFIYLFIYLESIQCLFRVHSVFIYLFIFHSIFIEITCEICKDRLEKIVDLVH